MALFTDFEAPGLLDELKPDAAAAWSTTFKDHTEQFAFAFDRYFDPIAADAPTEAIAKPIVWSASPARLLSEFTDRRRWELADSTRDQQDEYCEWRVTRGDDGKLTSVTFSTEVPEYWEHVAEHDRGLLVDLYRELVDEAVEEADLFEGKRYLRDNKWNHATSVGIAHLRQGSNQLLAALQLVAQSTVQRVDGAGRRVEDRHELVVCGNLGESKRNSDPQIADIVNDAVFSGFAVSLASPLGLYLEPLQAAAFQAPDGADASEFWTSLRGEAGHVVRARLEVPADAGYVLGDLTIGGRPLEFGTQVADKVPIRVDALVAPSGAPLTTKRCGE